MCVDVGVRRSIMCLCDTQGVVAYKVFRKNCNAEAFIQFFRYAQTAICGRIVIIDNASIHKTNEAQDALINMCIRVQFQTPYAPHQNGAELVFNSIRQDLQLDMKWALRCTDRAIEMTMERHCNFNLRSWALNCGYGYYTYGR